MLKDCLKKIILDLSHCLWRLCSACLTFLCTVLGESVMQRKSTCSQKPKLSKIECGHQMDGDHYVLCFGADLRFLWS